MTYLTVFPYLITCSHSKQLLILNPRSTFSHSTHKSNNCHRQPPHAAISLRQQVNHLSLLMVVPSAHSPLLKNWTSPPLLSNSQLLLLNKYIYAHYLLHSYSSFNSTHSI
ncbi:hypothetical protein GYH30_023225 [Glycine max]|uniref:Uncharacterized protein n=1 Tax=Glycine max TaxID=3847 RepID=A0A0R0J4V9_SOYBN|nr:hypothetical protein GYH30_023225 [Glycine max]